MPQLKLDGQVVEQGATMPLGEDLPFVTVVELAGRGPLPPHTQPAFLAARLLRATRNAGRRIPAGDYLSVNAVAGNVSPIALKARQEQTKPSLERNRVPIYRSATASILAIVQSKCKNAEHGRPNKPQTLHTSHP